LSEVSIVTLYWPISDRKRHSYRDYHCRDHVGTGLHRSCPDMHKCNILQQSNFLCRRHCWDKVSNRTLSNHRRSQCIYKDYSI